MRLVYPASDFDIGDEPFLDLTAADGEVRPEVERVTRPSLPIRSYGAVMVAVGIAVVVAGNVLGGVDTPTAGTSPPPVRAAEAEHHARHRVDSTPALSRRSRRPTPRPRRPKRPRRLAAAPTEVAAPAAQPMQPAAPPQRRTNAPAPTRPPRSSSVAAGPGEFF